MRLKNSMALLSLAALPLIVSAAPPANPPRSPGARGASTIPVSPAGKEDRALATAIATEATNAFQEIKSRIIAGDFDAIKSRILDNGKPVSPQARWEELKKDLAREGQLLSADSLKNAPLTKPVIERQSRFQVDIEKKTVASGEVITVTFSLTGTNTVGKKEFPALQGTPTIAEDGTLIILMKKIEGKWYWHPFGW